MSRPMRRSAVARTLSVEDFAVWDHVGMRNRDTDMNTMTVDRSHFTVEAPSADGKRQYFLKMVSCVYVLATR